MAELVVSLSEQVAEAASNLAASENRSVGELIQELVLQHERDVRWRKLKQYGLERGRASGYTEEDVVPMMREVRETLARERNEGK